MKSEKGQAIVFLALGIVTFLGFVALAIDGGLVFADRRHAQNGSDASSLSGAGAAAVSLSNDSSIHPEVTYPDWDCTSYWVHVAEWLGQNSAIARGASNGFTIDPLSLDTDNTYVTTSCRDWWNSAYFDRWLDVTVNISDSTVTSFAHLLFPQPLGNVVSATARVYPKTPFGFGHAIVALREWCQQNPNEGGAHFNGSNNVYINGGGIFSNACLETSGGNNNIVDVSGGNNICIPYQVDVNGNSSPCYEDNGSPDFVPAPGEGLQETRILVDITEPNCADPSIPSFPKVSLNNNQTKTLDPGRYPEISVQGGTLYLNPGLYCIMDPGAPNQGDGNVTFNGGVIEGPTGYNINDPSYKFPYPTGVSFFLDQGGFTTSGNATVRLTAAMVGSCEPDPASTCPGIKNLGTDLTAVLVYLAEGNTNDITLVGTGDDDYTGLLYSPSGTANLVGNGTAVSFNLQIVADTISIGGNAVLNINYDDDIHRWTSAIIELAK